MAFDRSTFSTGGRNVPRGLTPPVTAFRRNDGGVSPGIEQQKRPIMPLSVRGRADEGAVTRVRDVCALDFELCARVLETARLPRARSCAPRGDAGWCQLWARKRGPFARIVRVKGSGGAFSSQPTARTLTR